MEHISRDVCMSCREKPPAIEARKGLDGDHVWLCEDCFPRWKAVTEGPVGTKAAVHGIARRRFDDEESPCATCEGLYLAPPHGELLYSRRKGAVAKHRPFPELENGTFVLVSGSRAYGVVALGDAEEVTPEEFDARFDEHRVTTKERAKWWPEAESLWLYPVKHFVPLELPVDVAVPSGVQTFLDEVVLIGADCKSPPWTVSNPPSCAQSWSKAEKRKCVKAANAELARTGDEKKAIFACIAAAGKSEKKDATLECPERDATLEGATEGGKAMGKTKRDRGMEFTSSAYLYVPDADKPSTWKIRVEETPGKVTVKQLGRAAAALGPKGFMGQRAQMPDADRKSCAKQLVGLYRKHDVADDDLPAYLWKVAGMSAPKGKGTKELRLDEFVDHIRSAWSIRYRPELPSYSYVVEVWDNHIVVEEGTSFFQVPYELDGDEEPVFAPRDEWTEVERIWSAVKAFTGEDGRDWLQVWTMNAFEDRDEEIFTTGAIEAYVERHMDDEVKGRFMLWHLPATDFGDIAAQAVVGRFLVEFGPFDQDAKGQAFAGFFKKYPYGHPEYAPTGWGASHGYQYLESDRKDGVYEWFDKKETSVLPAEAASNPWNPSMEVFKMNDKQRALLMSIVGEELLGQTEATGLAMTAQLEKAGVSFKEVVKPTGNVEPVMASATPEGGVVAEGSKPTDLQELAKTLQLDQLSELLEVQTTALQTVAAELKDLKSKVVEMEKEDEVRLAEKETTLPRYFWFQASQAAETVVAPTAPNVPGVRVKGATPRVLTAVVDKLAQGLE